MSITYGKDPKAFIEPIRRDEYKVEIFRTSEAISRHHLETMEPQELMKWLKERAAAALARHLIAKDLVTLVDVEDAIRTNEKRFTFELKALKDNNKNNGLQNHDYDKPDPVWDKHDYF
jgi:hypothetical protein